MNVIVIGKGAMGKRIATRIEESDEMDLVAIIDPNKETTLSDYYCDLLIDFSHPDNLEMITEYGVKTKTPLLLATTGYTKKDLSLMKETSEIVPVMYSQNYSLGINIIVEVLRRFSPLLEEFDIEIIEKHHNQKLDSPSGTAKMIVESLNGSLENDYQVINGRDGMNKRRDNEIGVHAIRGGTFAGEHTIIFAGNDEVIEIKHSALSKEIFVSGALRAAKFLLEQEEGLYSMEDLINEEEYINATTRC